MSRLTNEKLNRMTSALESALNNFFLARPQREERLNAFLSRCGFQWTAEQVLGAILEGRPNSPHDESLELTEEQLQEYLEEHPDEHIEPVEWCPNYITPPPAELYEISYLNTRLHLCYLMARYLYHMTVPDDVEAQWRKALNN